MYTAGDHVIGEGPFAGLVVPHKRFAKIYADPPWGWRTWNSLYKVTHRGPEAPYLPMRRPDLEALPVASLAAPNCLLAMWTVSSHLDQALDLVRVWGFAFKSIGFIWVKTDKTGKPRMGMGRWTRQEAEVCLLATRGRPPRVDGGVRQVIMQQRREHSRKPDEVRARIDRLVAGPGLELFARESAPGWTAWGNEAGKFDDIPTAAPAAAGPPPGAQTCAADIVGRVCHCARCVDRRAAIMQSVRG